MQLNSLFFPAPKTTQTIQEFKDHIIWIPRKKFFNHSEASPKHKISNKQFIKKFGNQVKETAKISKPCQSDEDDYYNPHCNLTTQEEDELIEMDEYIPIKKIEGRSLPIHVNNYITKNFLEINSFQIKTPTASNYSSHQSSPKFDEQSYASGSKGSAQSFRLRNYLSSKKMSLNEELARFAYQEDDIQSEPILNRNKNKHVNNEECDEREFYSQPVPNNNAQLNKKYRESLYSLQMKNNKCQSADSTPLRKVEECNSTHIVASLLKSNLENTQYIVIYFHSNGEDIITSYDLVNHLRKNLNVHVVTVEYPGYTYYEGNASAEQIQEDALEVYFYFTEVLKVAAEKIIVIGRSIGTGPATYLASKKPIGCLTLVSPFTSLRDLVKDKVGSVIQYLIQDRFNNLENIKQVKCPTFISHGQKDTLIEISHSQALHNNCRGICELILPKDMNHNQLDYYRDLSMPLSNFLIKNGFKINQTNKQKSITFPEYLFENPSSFKQ